MKTQNYSRAPAFGLLAIVGILATSAPDAKADNRYWGEVGGLEAVFTLKFGPGDEVTGVYSYPSRPGVAYRLVGSNPRKGVLILDEYSDGRKTARCELTKGIDGANIVWSGTMQNTDGRKFSMSFSRDGIDEE